MFQQVTAVKNHVRVSRLSRSNSGLDFLFLIFWPGVLASREVTCTSSYFVETKQAGALSPEATQAQEGQSGFKQRGRCHAPPHCATLLAATQLVLPTHTFSVCFFWICFEDKLESLQIRLESPPICFQQSETWSDRSEFSAGKKCIGRL